MSRAGSLVQDRPPEPMRSESGKVEQMKALIRDLHDGLSPEEARVRFNSVVRDVSPEEIGIMEEQLIREGMPVQEIQRLCDLHVAVVQDGLDRQEEMPAPPGHPVHTYRAENRIITQKAQRLASLCGDDTREDRTGSRWRTLLTETLDEISGIHNHYLRKENELFPLLERHGITGPSQVMWGVHDEIRGRHKEAVILMTEGDLDEAAETATALARDVVEMIYKEEKILLPLAMKTLNSDEWALVRKGEDELGYAFFAPAAPFPPSPFAFPKEKSEELPVISPPGLPVVSPVSDGPPPAPDKAYGDEAYLDLGTGRLSVRQVDLILRHLPVEISFVDTEGFVRYYSDTPERLFPRTPGAIGRHVENCHPPKSLHMVKEILNRFQAGEQDVAQFWIEMQGRFIHIRYFAVRNDRSDYLGCLEVTQDVTEIRELEGQRRLLEWQ
jgi:DUF438 domain-containing protein